MRFVGLGDSEEEKPRFSVERTTEEKKLVSLNLVVDRRTTKKKEKKEKKARTLLCQGCSNLTS